MSGDSGGRESGAQPWCSLRNIAGEIHSAGDWQHHAAWTGRRTWFVDERDGKRLFVPNTTVDGVSPKDFRRMAVEITNDTKGEVAETVR